MKRLLFILCVVLPILMSCVKKQEVSPIPSITFQSLEVSVQYDSSLEQYLPMGVLVFDFIDGDADIGLYRDQVDSITWKESNYNVFLIPYEKIDTTYIPIVFDTAYDVPPWYKIWQDEKLDRVGQNKVIKGTISIRILDLPEPDTIRYEFFIRDRAGHNSNVAVTNDVGTQLDN